MSNTAYQLAAEPDELSASDSNETGSVPRITIHAFFETPEMAAIMESAAADRRMSRAHVLVRGGGVAAAIEIYRETPTPNLILLESDAGRSALFSALDALAEACETGTKIIVVGRLNDVTLFRDLLERGVSDYLVAPFDVRTLIGSVSRLYGDAGDKKLGRVCAFFGVRGGVGSSTIAHNVAAALAHNYDVDVMLADMDLAFGSADLNFNLTPSQGMAEAIRDVDRLDEALLDRLLTSCSRHLSLLAAPAALNETSDFVEGTFQRMIEVAQAHVPLVVLDVPHVWTAWTRKTLFEADEVVVVATPDLASLRNAKSLVTLLLQARPNDAPPRLVLNQVGMRKQHEIAPAAFAKALDLAPISTIRFDPQIFGAAANNGKMIGDIAAKSDIASAFVQIAVAVAGRKEVKRQAAGIAGLFRRMGKW